MTLRLVSVSVLRIFRESLRMGPVAFYQVMCVCFEVNVEQEGISVECQPADFRQSVLHSEQV